MAKKGKAARQAARKTEGRKEGLAWIAALIRSKIEEYRAHEPPAPVAGDDVRSYAAARMRRDQWLAEVRWLWWFFRAAKVFLSAKNKKGFDQLLGIKAGRGRPVVQERRAKILERLLKIALLRSAGRQWKVIGRECGMTPQAAKRLYERELQNLPEAKAKEIAARMERKPPPIGKAKARSAALGKEIATHNRRRT